MSKKLYLDMNTSLQKQSYISKRLDKPNIFERADYGEVIIDNSMVKDLYNKLYLMLLENK